MTHETKNISSFNNGIVCVVYNEYETGTPPMCYCYLNETGTITCEGGFSDGSSATE